MSRLPPWTPFKRAIPVMSPRKYEAIVTEIIRIAQERDGMILPRAAVERMIQEEREDQEMWQNSRYTVLVFRNEPARDGGPKMIHLSIRRNDRQRPREERYRDFQRIKTELIGADHEGVELYPAEHRVADCADQYHIYVLAEPGVEFPFGFQHGFRAGPQKGSPVVQSAFEE